MGGERSNEPSHEQRRSESGRVTNRHQHTNRGMKTQSGVRNDDSRFFFAVFVWERVRSEAMCTIIQVRSCKSEGRNRQIKGSVHSFSSLHNSIQFKSTFFVLSFVCWNPAGRPLRTHTKSHTTRSTGGMDGMERRDGLSARFPF